MAVVATGSDAVEPSARGRGVEVERARRSASFRAMTAVEVRRAVVPGELSCVRALFDEYAASLDIDLSFQGFAEEVASLPGRYASPAGGLWLAWLDGEVAGCIGLRPLDGPVGELKRLYVRPAHRASGLGRLLVEAALAHADAAGYARVRLDTLPSMAGAIALYRSLGFARIEADHDHPIVGTLFMERLMR